jgi:acetyl esterase/lipase
MGWLAWTGIGVLFLALSLLVGVSYAMATNAVALLDDADALFRGNAQIKLVAATQYGPDAQQKLEMFVPAKPTTAGSAPYPIVVFIHGGGWDSGDPHYYRFIARALVPHGYAVVLPGYRLFPNAKFPGMVEDGASALRWVHDHAAALGGDPSRVVMMGHSAGAYNAAMLVLDKHWLAHEGLDANTLRGFIGLAGPYDFLPLDTDATRNSFGDAADLPATQPIRFARADAPPMLLLTGDADKTVFPRNSVALARAMTEAGRPMQADILPGLSHTRIIMQMARPFAGNHAVLDRVLPFLASVTAPASSAAVQPTVH